MNATGMQLKSIPGCAREGILYPQGTLFRRYVQHTGVGRHSTSQQAGYPRTEEAGE